MIAIFIQSSYSSIKLPDIDFELADKLLHFIVFGILGILTARGLRKSVNKKISENYFAITIGMSILYGASHEIHQYFVPGRHSSWGDWLADMLGIIIMVGIYKIIIDYQELKNKKLSENGSVI